MLEDPSLALLSLRRSHLPLEYLVQTSFYSGRHSLNRPCLPRRYLVPLLHLLSAVSTLPHRWQKVVLEKEIHVSTGCHTLGLEQTHYFSYPDH